MPMKIRKWDDVRRRKLSPEKLDKIDRDVERELLEMSLSELREKIGVTQAELAEAAKMAQGDVSRIERRRDHLVSSLRRVIEALGGELHITARFKDKEVELRGV